MKENQENYSFSQENSEEFKYSWRASVPKEDYVKTIIIISYY